MQHDISNYALCNSLLSKTSSNTSLSGEIREMSKIWYESKYSGLNRYDFWAGIK